MSDYKSVLLDEIEKFSNKYLFSFQFWGKDNNNVFIEKGDVEVYSSGGHETIEEVLLVTLEWLYRVNRTPEKNRVRIEHIKWSLPNGTSKSSF